MHPGLIRRLLFALALGLPGTAAGQSPAAADRPEFDLVLRHGTVIDGTGGPGFRADVGVRDGRITAVGDLGAARAGTRIECRDRCVAPGFVDVHTHVDSEIGRRPTADNFVRMGVTTLITGNCGSSVRDLAAHLARCERGGLSVNYGSLIGHGTVRTQVMGTANRAPTAEELAQMAALVEQAMQDGAFGLSTGLIYVPGTYARTEELIALSRVVAQHGGLYASHQRNEGDTVLDSIAEALRIGREAGLPVHLSHLKASGRNNWGRGAEIVATLRKARSAGVRVTGDQYAYDASSTGLDVLFPDTALDIGREAFGKRLNDDPEFRQTMHRALCQRMERSGFGDFAYCRIASAPGLPELNGLLVPAAAQQKLGRDDRDAQAEMVLVLMATGGARRVGMVYHGMAEQDVATILAEDWIAVASDAGLRDPLSPDRPHPRGSGNNPRVLGRYVREQHALSLELAVHKMTALPCQIFGIADRGVIRPGAFADLVVFDPATVQDQATWQDPVQPPLGIEHVLVNGVQVLQASAHTGQKPGAVLRHAKEPR